ncbi:hypothetical protein GRFL_3463 [Christiangramia flava JLT2011]|uniref:Uncharacterized protein n=1 Tax=Christiangramia flava JLT2011 TaxID=1229726 RepID=A0A1L7I9A6_9FLAO|nr:hypothetical protein GRFL_3463 [Christiangramia flava JLT2011]
MSVRNSLWLFHSLKTYFYYNMFYLLILDVNPSYYLSIDF